MRKKKRKKYLLSLIIASILLGVTIHYARQPCEEKKNACDTKHHPSSEEHLSKTRKEFIDQAWQDAFLAAQAVGQNEKEAEAFANKAEDAAKEALKRENNVLDF